jgi:hypothetical protein
MGQRVDKLPFDWYFWGDPLYEMDAEGNWQESTRTHACTKGMQDFEARFPQATEFDWETFQIGWNAGAEWARGNACIQEQPIGACNSPEPTSITDSQRGGEL